MSEQRGVRAVRARVTGRVQGVGFRAYAAQAAVRHEVTGWVRNEPGGSVALHVEGPADAVGAVLDWCRDGSPSASVDGVEVEDVDPERGDTFEVRY